MNNLLEDVLLGTKKNQKKKKRKKKAKTTIITVTEKTVGPLRSAFK